MTYGISHWCNVRTYTHDKTTFVQNSYDEMQEMFRLLRRLVELAEAKEEKTTTEEVKMTAPGEVE